MIVEILSHIKSTAGSNGKKAILRENIDNDLLKKVLEYGLDPFTPFNIVKVPKTESRFPMQEESQRWGAFFSVADLCASRTYTGNFAIGMMQDVFMVVTEEEEKWMRKILKKHLAIGASIKTVNSVFPSLVKTFDVSLAQKFDMKRLKGRNEIAIEPKLDGIRCFAIVREESVQLFARSGKLISNFDSTIGKELLKMGDGCYDGELMGDDFVSIMRQAYRKDSVDVSSTYLALFDYLPLKEWDEMKPDMMCDARYDKLLDKLTDNDVNLEIIQPVERFNVEANYDEIKSLHDDFVAEGFEGAMIKYLDAPYKFGRGYEVMKLKTFHDVDLPIDSLEEGTGKHKGKLGSIVVTFKGVEVRVGSGFSDELRDKIWYKPEDFIGRIVEVRYQEVTPDGSLRFPTFVCFRNDR